MAQSYKPLYRYQDEKIKKKLTEDSFYWRRLKQSAVFQEPNLVTNVCFSPSADANVVGVTSSTRLSIIDPIYCEPIVVYSRFKEEVYGIAFRNDGKLVGVGNRDGKVRIFDGQRYAEKAHGSKNPLRKFKAHSSPVHVVFFNASGKLLITMSDEGQICVFDITDPQAEPVRVIANAHCDHIRCGDVSSLNDNLFVSGSYDHTAKVWNLSKEDNEPVVKVLHESPIEKVLFLTGDTFLVTAGDRFIKIWDIASGGNLIHILQNHHKTVTSLCLASNCTRLLSGGLDKRINVFSLNTGDYRLVHSFTVPEQVLSLSISKNDHYMAVGMSNLLAIYRREAERPLERSMKEGKLKDAGLEYRRTIRVAAPDPKEYVGNEPAKKVQITAPAVDKIRIGIIDKLLRQYQHWKAVDILFRRSHFFISNPDGVVAALTEIHKRHMLSIALAGRKIDTLRPICYFLQRHLFNPLYFPILNVVATTLFDVYKEENLDQKVVKAFKKLNDSIGRELSIQKGLHTICGTLSMLFAASMHAENVEKMDDDVFGEIAVVPIPFSMDENAEDAQLTSNSL